MMHMPQVRQAYAGGGYDFSSSFQYIKEYIRDAEYAVCNFESTLPGEEEGYAGFPRFKSPDEIASDLVLSGFDLISTANNHSLDAGIDALFRTIDVFEKAGAKTFGTYRSREEQKKPLIVEENNLKIAFLAYTESTNMIPVPAGKEFSINYIGASSDVPIEKKAAEVFKRDIEICRSYGADIVAVYMHWGQEYRTEPVQTQKDLAAALAESGADIILGSHPHVVQPMEFITEKENSGAKRDVFVAYSMGNFLSNQHYRPRSVPTHEVEYGKILNIILKKNRLTGKAYVDDVQYVLTWVNRESGHKIIPLHSVVYGDYECPQICSLKREEIENTWEEISERLDNFDHASFE